MLRRTRCVILDEADQMLERGFADTMDEILASCFHEGNMTIQMYCIQYSPPFPSVGCTDDNKPQMLLFSATIPSWVQQTADKYMSKDRVVVDLVGRNTVRTAVNVEVT